MKKAILKKICLLSVLCVAMMSFLLHFSMTCYGQEEPCPIRVEVSPYQINIDSDGEEHYVRILTYTWYSNTAGAFVYINENLDAISTEFVKLTRDSVGHLVVKIDLIALQQAELDVGTYHDLKIVVQLKEARDGCLEQEGTGEIYIIGKQGATQSVQD